MGTPKRGKIIFTLRRGPKTDMQPQSDTTVDSYRIDIFVKYVKYRV